MSVVVYLLIPTSNHNQPVVCNFLPALYIFWFLHQTTTSMRKEAKQLRCISFDSYIKPQRSRGKRLTASVVYLLIPTSNHNKVATRKNHIKLYIFWFLHQTTTPYQLYQLNNTLYIFWFLHQTTTSMMRCVLAFGCISFDSYIKPQLRLVLPVLSAVVYLLIPTSNHNCTSIASCTWTVVYLLIPTSNHNTPGNGQNERELYIFWFLHQTTTWDNQESPQIRCISFDSYIKPQLKRLRQKRRRRCISFDSYIKPQLRNAIYYVCYVVYLLIPTSNHNYLQTIAQRAYVVYLLIPTSNHNCSPPLYDGKAVVYLLIPTSNHNGLCTITFSIKLYIFWFLHQTTTK